MNLIHIFNQSVLEKPDATFLLDQERTYSYGDIYTAVEKLTAKITGSGIKGAQTVGILMADSPEYIVAYLAILKAGATVTLLPTERSITEIAGLATTARLKGAIFQEKFKDHLPEIENLLGSEIEKISYNNIDCGNFSAKQLEVPTLKDSSKSKPKNDPAVIFFSSGSRRQSRPVLHTHESIANITLACAERLSIKYTTRFISNLPLNHFFPNATMVNLAIATGNAIVFCQDKSTQSIIENINRHQVNILVGNATIFNELADYQQTESTDLASLALGISIGGSYSREFMDLFQQKYNALVGEGYGIAEAPIVTLNYNSNQNKAGSVGIPLAGCQLRLGGELIKTEAGTIGELEIKGQNLFWRYFDQFSNQALYQDNWFATGDFFHQDEEEFWYYNGKMSDWIHRYGFAINPADVETIIRKHPQIDCAVVCTGNGLNQHRALKVIVEANEDNSLNEQEIMEYCKKNLASYLIPDSIHIVPHIQKNILGFPRRNEYHRV